MYITNKCVTISSFGVYQGYICQMEICTFFTPCTDLLVLMLQYFNNISTDFGPSFYKPLSDSTINTQNLSASLHINVISTMFSMHTFSGCDITSSPCGVSKTRIIKVVENALIWCMQTGKPSIASIYTFSTLLCWNQINNETLWQRQQMFNFKIFKNVVRVTSSSVEKIWNIMAKQ